jgi:hypothetical protein
MINKENDKIHVKFVQDEKLKNNVINLLQNYLYLILNIKHQLIISMYPAVSHVQKIGDAASSLYAFDPPCSARMKMHHLRYSEYVTPLSKFVNNPNLFLGHSKLNILIK